MIPLPLLPHEPRLLALQAVQRSRALFALLAFFVLLLGRFWWFGEATTWAGFIRTCLYLTLLLGVVEIRRLPGHLRTNPLLIVVLAFLSYAALSSLFLGDAKVARRALLMLAFLLAIYTICREVQYRCVQVLQAMVMASSLVAIATLWLHWQSGLLFTGYREAAISGTGILGFAEFENSVLASLEMSFSLIVCAWLALRARHWPERIVWVLCALPILLYVYSTFGRTGWLATAIGFLALIMQHPGLRARYMLLVILLVNISLIGALFHERIAFELFTRSLTHRDEIWAMVLNLMPGYWLIGHGADASVENLLGTQLLGGQFPFVINHSHSIYIEVLFNFGVLGLLGLLAVLACAFRQLWIARNTELARLWFAVLTGMTVAMAFDFSSLISTPNLVWLWLWLPISWAVAVGSAIGPLTGAGQRFIE